MSLLKELLKDILRLKHVTVVIPCYNEEATIARVVSACRTARLVDEVLVVDDGSSDASSEAAHEAGAIVLRNESNQGKGAALLAGARAAKNDVIVFIDADFVNVSPEVVESLANPVLDGEAKVCKAFFEREGGRVTELVAKPLLEFLFPELCLQQPLSGQFAVSKKFLLDLDLDEGWGIDLSVILESLKKGETVMEVNIGSVEHKHRSLNELSKTSRQVIQTILQNAGFLSKKHKLIFFDFDRTLVTQSSVEVLASAFGFKKQLERERALFLSGKITERDLTKRIARMLKGRKASELEEVASKLKKNAFADETLNYLRRMGYKTAVVSFGFKQVISTAFPRVFDSITSPVLEVNRGVFTGQVRIPPFKSGKRVFCKGAATKALLKEFGVKCEEAIAVGDDESDDEMFKWVGIPVIFKPRGGVSCITRRSRFPALSIRSLSDVVILAG
ncbi:MAG: HAD-IB family phosphatase [Candidatus Micrarchaeota archaeon]